MAQETNKKETILVVVKGEVASSQALNEILPEKIKSMLYLSSDKAVHLYGVIGANGALLVQTQKK